jgi:hypothetical protein
MCERSRHLYEDGAPKTESADRWVELFPETVRILRALEPLHVLPESPVFTTTEGRPSSRRRSRRATGTAACARLVSESGIYATKDTFVTVARQANVKVAWLEAQTGVAYATLKRHYGTWTTPEGTSELERFAALDPTLFGGGPDPKLPWARGQHALANTHRVSALVGG